VQKYCVVLRNPTDSECRVRVGEFPGSERAFQLAELVALELSVEADTVETAQALRQAMLSELDGLADHIVPIRSIVGDAAPSLHAENLISGVVHALLDDGALVDE
jgi:hypothetical protein